ncbi:Tellurite resistance protein TerB [Streptomyces sp. DvalAA-14]|uniref:TerB family tellurite resistance protein n=1 Tax=unclassified Streptomyces TaxID=2593676 RepID=UPI00081AECF6|nr:MULTISPECIES: TerB family tellurite resistance protein [unclassified Streptomyces]MYS22207.1 TerB family tellurite resistance protein [Streptomyces sp. SID4948]SCE11238.1 Tellurite resistance protein TerB [Streptomyces sp. DvalAA-14]
MKLGLYIWGVRTAWHTEDDGEFFCPDCGGDRAYHRRTGTRRLTVLNVPLMARGPAGTVIECTACHRQFGAEVLLTPTTTRFSAMLRDAVHTIALAVLTAGGAGGRPAREAAVGAVRAAGFTDCTEDQLLGLLAAIVADEGRFRHSDELGPDSFAEAVDGCGSWLSIELHEALEPLADHLLTPGRERVLLEGAHIALADGPYLPAEREVLEAVGRCLSLHTDDIDRLLTAAAATPS